MRHQRRRIQVFQHHMRLWHAQEPSPQPFEPGIRVVTSLPAHRSEFFGPLHGTELTAAERLHPYGRHELLAERDLGGHVALNQAVLANRDPELLRLLREALEAGVSRLYVEASEAARKFFLRAGFVVVRRRDFERNNVQIHNYLMEKTIR